MSVIVNDYKFNGLRFELTCMACPEQYDVYKDGSDETCAYVRLRGGRLSASVPDVGGKMIYLHYFHDNDLKGEFDTESERVFYLSKIADSILNNMNAKETCV